MFPKSYAQLYFSLMQTILEWFKHNNNNNKIEEKRWNSTFHARTIIIMHTRVRNFAISFSFLFGSRSAISRNKQKKKNIKQTSHIILFCFAFWLNTEFKYRIFCEKQVKVNEPQEAEKFI